jgi:hypothetical protein
MSVTERLQVLQRTAPMPSAGQRRGALVPFIVLALPTLLPAAVFYLFPVPSISTGMLIACLMILGLTAIGGLKISKYFQKSRFISIIALAIILIALHLFVASLFVDAQFDRALQSLAFLAVVFVSTAPISSVLRDYSISIDRAAEWMRIVLLAIALFGLARIQPQQYGVAISGEKSVFPFAEPSHFALIFIPFLLHACVRNRGWWRYVWLGIAFLLTYSLQSLSLGLGTILVASICLPVSRMVLLAAVAAMLIPTLSIEYFVDRLDFSLFSNSISSLVYRQGWELAADAAYRTFGWGIGFQQLGFVAFFSPAADVLLQILLDDTNLRDGGFLAAKILSELGVFGVLLLLAYFTSALRSALFLRKYAVGEAADVMAEPAELFARSFICGVSLEFLVRGLGYFSGSILICISSIMLLNLMRRSSV